MSSQQALWTVRGDDAGTYQLTGIATGTLQLGGATLPLNSSLQSSPFQVIQPQVSLAFETPASVMAGQNFTVGIDVTNSNSIDLGGVTVTLQAGNLTNCSLASAPAVTIGTLAAGQTQHVEFTLTSQVTGVVLSQTSYNSPAVVQPSVQVRAQVVLPPTASDDYASVATNTAITLPVLANDTSPQGYPLSVTSVTQGEHGMVVLNADNTVTYTPAPGFNGTDAFNYSLSDGHGNTASALVSVAVGTVTVAGTVLLEGCLNPVQSINFTFRPLDGSPSFTRTMTLPASGAFSFSGLPARNYNVAIKGAIWLQSVAGADGSQGASVGNIAVRLGAGDANNDNTIDTYDFNILVLSFGSSSSSPGSGYDPRADFNCDGTVDTADFNLLVLEFGNSGAP